MSRMAESIHVDVPVRVGYDQWTQFESFTSFMDGVESVTPDRPTHTHRVTTIGDVTRQSTPRSAGPRPEPGVKTSRPVEDR